jgi:hypothetical protein
MSRRHDSGFDVLTKAPWRISAGLAFVLNLILS